MSRKVNKEGGSPSRGVGETGRPVDDSEDARRLSLSLYDFHFSSLIFLNLITCSVLLLRVIFSAAVWRAKRGVGSPRSANASCLCCGDEEGGRGYQQKYGALHLSLAVCVPSPASPPAGNTSPLCEHSQARAHKHH